MKVIIIACVYEGNTSEIPFLIFVILYHNSTFASVYQKLNGFVITYFLFLCVYKQLVLIYLYKQSIKFTSWKNMCYCDIIQLITPMNPIISYPLLLNISCTALQFT